MYGKLGRILRETSCCSARRWPFPPFLPGTECNDQTFSIDGKPCNALINWSMTYPFNLLSRCPAATVPSGFASSGVPTGLQIVGRTPSGQLPSSTQLWQRRGGNRADRYPSADLNFFSADPCLRLFSGRPVPARMTCFHWTIAAHIGRGQQGPTSVLGDFLKAALEMGRPVGKAGACINAG